MKPGGSWGDGGGGGGGGGGTSWDVLWAGAEAPTAARGASSPRGSRQAAGMGAGRQLWRSETERVRARQQDLCSSSSGQVRKRDRKAREQACSPQNGSGRSGDRWEQAGQLIRLCWPLSTPCCRRLLVSRSSYLSRGRGRSSGSLDCSLKAPSPFLQEQKRAKAEAGRDTFQGES